MLNREGVDGRALRVEGRGAIDAMELCPTAHVLALAINAWAAGLALPGAREQITGGANAWTNGSRK